MRYLSICSIKWPNVDEISFLSVGFISARLQRFLAPMQAMPTSFLTIALLSCCLGRSIVIRLVSSATMSACVSFDWVKAGGCDSV